MTLLPFSTPKARWSATVARNSDAVGSFVYAVKTTRIYCRPDCKSRLARQANVVFFDSGLLAEEAGYRACKRCKPGLEDQDLLFDKVQRAVNLVKENASKGQKIGLGELSAQVGLSKWHLQRVFSRHVGLSPHELSRSILRSMESEAEGMGQFPVTPVGSDTSSNTTTDLSEPISRDEFFHDAGDPVFLDWNWESLQNVDADDVLRDLFPELYSTL